MLRILRSERDPVAPRRLSRWKPNPENELSYFLIIYLLVLLSVLLFVHLLQPEREGSGSSSKSPIHHERQK